MVQHISYGLYPISYRRSTIFNFRMIIHVKEKQNGAPIICKNEVLHLDKPNIYIWFASL